MSEMKLELDVFSRFNDRWALVCAGGRAGFNAMAISWGGLGTLWSRPAATVYVKPIRYTWEFLQKNDYFTVIFLPDRLKKAVGVMGSHSGRDCDKVRLAGLTPVFLENGVTFAEAETTLVCRRMYTQNMTRDTMPADVIADHYTDEEPHTVFIGQVTEIL